MRHPSKSSSAAAAASGSTASKTTPCCIKVGLKRGPWTPEEDELLSNYINKEGEGRWRTLPKRAGLLRCGKSCRLRWMNYLRPSVKRGQIAPDEEDLILRLHRLLGNRWSLIAGRIPGRTDNEIKNYWNTHLSKKLISQGIDPRTHKNLNSTNHSSSDDNSTKPSSSSKAISNQMPTQNPNHVSAPAALEEPVISTGYGRIMLNKGNRYSHEGESHYHGGAHLVNLQDCEDNCDHDDLNYCNDDVFSSFLNSLINEDVFNTSQQQQLLQLQANGIASAINIAGGSNDPLIISPPQNFALGAGWDAPIMSSSGAGFNHSLHAEKQL